MTGLEGVNSTQAAAKTSSLTLEDQFARLERALSGQEPLDADVPATANPTAAALAVVAFPLAANAAGPRLSYRAHEQFPSASTIKVFVLQALLEKVAGGDTDLDDELIVTAEDQVTGSGILKSLTPGRAYTLRDLATLMITVSDNTATNVLIDFVGLDQLNDSIQAHGWRGTRSSGKLQLGPAVGGTKRSPSATTAADLADYFARLWRGELLPATLTAEAQAIYRKQQFTELTRSIDYDSYSASIGESTWLVASKSGSIRGVRNDAGVFEAALGSGKNSYVLAVLSKGCADERFHANNVGARVVGLASQAVFRAFNE